MIGDAPHLLDPEALDSSCTAEDGKQCGFYHIPASSNARSDDSLADFSDSVSGVKLSS